MEIKRIDYGKLPIIEIFNDWYTVPSYQRHYVWETDNVMDMLYDFKDGMEHHPNDEYFLGSYIYQGNEADKNKDLLDGQQRITTLFLLFAYLRDYGNLEPKMQEILHGYVYQEENKLARKKDRVRLQYEIRGDVGDFIQQRIVNKGILADENNWQVITKIAKTRSENESINHICSTLSAFDNFFFENNGVNLIEFLAYILNNVVMLYVSASTLEDAFRLFSVMNDRGLKLGNADILKASNLEYISEKSEKAIVAKRWEDIQEELGENFDRFLSYVRTMILRTRAKQNLLDEFEKEIFQKKIISRGKVFFDLVFRAYGYYQKAIEPDARQTGYAYYNLVKVLRSTYPSTDWIPVVMFYYSKFNTSMLYEFTSKMIYKNLADITCGALAVTRVENLSKIIEAIKHSRTPMEVINNTKLYVFDHKKFMAIVNMDMFGRKFTKTLLMLMELKYLSNESEITSGIFSVEHILPQNPRVGSEWTTYYTPEQRNAYTHKIGNLCILTRKKNVAFSNLDYKEKKARYFDGKIDALPRTLSIINSHSRWNPEDFEQNQKKALEDIREMFDIHDVSSDYDDIKDWTYIEKQRLEYSKAYKPWSDEEEAQLLKLYYNRTPIEEISQILERNKGGITSRLAKLGVILDTNLYAQE